MHFRRLACLLLGAWMAGSLLMMMVATENFRSVDRLLEAPTPNAAKHIKALGRETARTFLRYQVSEQNRSYFVTWERVQFGLGGLLFLTLFFGNPTKGSVLLLPVLMLAAVAVMHFLLTPQIIRLGRLIDFVSPADPSANRVLFWNFHTAYTIAEVLKLGLGVILAARLLVRRHRRSAEIEREADLEVDAVNYTDDGHINRR